MSTITQEVDHDDLDHGQYIDHLLDMCDRLRYAIVFYSAQKNSQGYEWVDDSLYCLTCEIERHDQ